MIAVRAFFIVILGEEVVMLKGRMVEVIDPRSNGMTIGEVKAIDPEIVVATGDFDASSLLLVCHSRAKEVLAVE